jgi:hypothetical protein
MPSPVRFSTVKLVMLSTYYSNICDVSFRVRSLAKMARDRVSLTELFSFIQVSF